MRVCSRVLPGSTVDIVLIAPAEHHSEFLAPISFRSDFDTVPENAHRFKRDASDPYEAYYFYPKSLNQQRPYQYDRGYDEDSYINRRDADSNRIEQNGQKYKYTPLFQYKSTQSRRRKLFVPNLFG